MTDESHLSTPPLNQKRHSRFFGQYVIKYRFQFKFTLVVFTFLAVAALTTWVIGKVAVGKLIETGMVSDEQSIQSLRLMNQIVGQTSLLALAVTFGLAIFFSHFIAGPIYRFEKILEEMRAGNLNLHVRLRKRDEFKETAELFNQALASLRNKVQKERDALNLAVEKMRLVADDLRKAGRANEALELDQLVSDIKNIPPQIKI
jgi:methyl-accepting chemotaxis protein